MANVLPTALVNQFFFVELNDLDVPEQMNNGNEETQALESNLAQNNGGASEQHHSQESHNAENNTVMETDSMWKFFCKEHHLCLEF